MAAPSQSGRSSNRTAVIHTNDELQSIDGKKKEEIRSMYANDISHIDLAFVRILSSNIKFMDNDNLGIMEIAEIPKQIGLYEWGVNCVFFGANKVHIIDGFNAINDDKDYKKHLNSISEEQWTDKDEFFEQWAKAGKPVKQIWHEAYDKGKKDGINEVSILVTNQILIYLCRKMTGYLTEIVCKRGAEQKSFEHIPLYIFRKTGNDIIQSLARIYETAGDRHGYKDVDWFGLKEIVGIENLAKKVSDELYYYGDVTSFTYTESNQLVTMYFVGVRWDGANHRHRNIPLMWNDE
eukprot:48981_1